MKQFDFGIRIDIACKIDQRLGCVREVDGNENPPVPLPRFELGHKNRATAKAHEALEPCPTNECRQRTLAPMADDDEIVATGLLGNLFERVSTCGSQVWTVTPKRCASVFANWASRPTASLQLRIARRGGIHQVKNCAMFHREHGGTVYRMVASSERSVTARIDLMFMYS